MKIKKSLFGKSLDLSCRPVDAEASTAGQVAGPRQAPPNRPLSARHMLRAGLVRDGALAFADIPSRYGDQRVAHKAKVRTA